MKIIAISGGIASGKNFVASVFSKFGCLVFDADMEVHNLMRSDKSTFEEINRKFPQAVFEGKIDKSQKKIFRISQKIAATKKKISNSKYSSLARKTRLQAR